MFFIGSLTTIMPYLGTIILMLVFSLVGAPIKDLMFTAKADSTHEISISQSHQLENQESHSSASYDFTFNKNQESNTYVAKCEPFSNTEITCCDYCSRISLADSNKAPPTFI